MHFWQECCERVAVFLVPYWETHDVAGNSCSLGDSGDLPSPLLETLLIAVPPGGPLSCVGYKKSGFAKSVAKGFGE